MSAKVLKVRKLKFQNFVTRQKVLQKTHFFHLVSYKKILKSSNEKTMMWIQEKLLQQFLQADRK